jgi:hypothetical protein
MNIQKKYMTQPIHKEPYVHAGGQNRPTFALFPGVDGTQKPYSPCEDCGMAQYVYPSQNKGCLAYADRTPYDNYENCAYLQLRDSYDTDLVSLPFYETAKDHHVEKYGNGTGLDSWYYRDSYASRSKCNKYADWQGCEKCGINFYPKCIVPGWKNDPKQCNLCIVDEDWLFDYNNYQRQKKKP